MTDKIEEDVRRKEALAEIKSLFPAKELLELWAARAPVELRDYEARVAELEAENKRIAEELETSNANHRKMASEMAALGEENKRLRKCADAMADAIRHPHSWQLEYVRAKDAYRAAFPREEAKP